MWGDSQENGAVDDTPQTSPIILNYGVYRRRGCYRDSITTVHINCAIIFIQCGWLLRRYNNDRKNEISSVVLIDERHRWNRQYAA